MARGQYQYETSPRKIQPAYNPNLTRRKTTLERQQEEKLKREQEQRRRNALKQQKRKHNKNIAMIVGLFLLLLAISYRNSLITERFNQIQDKKQQLAAIEKTNGQLEVSIEGTINLSNIEKAAEELLGMQKLSNDQKVYVTLPKKDYTESSSQEIVQEVEKGWFANLIDNIFGE